MTPLEQIVCQSLLSYAPLSTLIGSRLYLVQLPQRPTYPAMTYQRIDTVPYTTLTQGSTFQQMGWARFQFTAWAQGPTAGSQTDQIARQLQAAMLTFSAAQQPWSPEIINQRPNLMLTRSMGIEPQTEPPLFKARIDYRILYWEQ